MSRATGSTSGAEIPAHNPAATIRHVLLQPKEICRAGASNAQPTVKNGRCCTQNAADRTIVIVATYRADHDGRTRRLFHQCEGCDNRRDMNSGQPKGCLTGIPARSLLSPLLKGELPFQLFTFMSPPWRSTWLVETDGTGRLGSGGIG